MDMAQRSGILPAHAIARLYETGAIASASPFAPGRSSRQASTSGSGMMPTGCGRRSCRAVPIRSKPALEALKLHRISLAGGAVLETGCVYIVPLQERLALPGDIAALSNPKSSTGRLDIFTRGDRRPRQCLRQDPAGLCRSPVRRNLAPHLSGAGAGRVPA